MIKCFFMKVFPFLLLAPFYAILVVFGYWAFIAWTPPAEVKIINYNPKVLAAGETFAITYEGIWRRDCDYHITKILRPLDADQKISIGYVERFHPKKESSSYVGVIKIPDTITDGKYEYISEIRTVCNFFDYMFAQTFIEPTIEITIDNRPAELTKIEIENPKLRSGESLKITSYFFKKRVCPASVDTLITLSDNTIVNKSSRPAINPNDGEQVVKELLDPGVPAGNYLLKRSILYDCHNKSYMLSYPTVSFEVINN